MEKTAKKSYWAVYVGQRWSDRVFLFENAKEAADFAENCVKHYNAKLSDYGDGNFDVSIVLKTDDDLKEKETEE